MRFALDTNILAYASGINGATMQGAAFSFLKKLPIESTLVPAQVLAELFYVLVRKNRDSHGSARIKVLDWRSQFAIIETSGDVIASAMDLAADHQLGFWDSIVLASASEASCRLLLSEDFQDGFTWRGVTVANPFSRSKHILIADLFGSETP